MGDRNFSKSLDIFTVIAFALICFVPLAMSQSQDPALQKSDVRLLIDISGSMKKNDPNNLRIPALQLVTNLLPKGADAGVWAFGRYVNMMVPLSKVDALLGRKKPPYPLKVSILAVYIPILAVY
ncbi:MAG: hypothetical protein Q9M92_14180 [Enterobacterales bacterium]|nr:hypothetical protein [Enterobacterales bacterium]